MVFDDRLAHARNVVGCAKKKKDRQIFSFNLIPYHAYLPEIENYATRCIECGEGKEEG